MSRRRIGQEPIGFEDGHGRRQSLLDELVKLIDWTAAFSVPVSSAP
jgi:hypothetical protein